MFNALACTYIFLLLMLTTYCAVGLLAIWAALGRSHWFVRFGLLGAALLPGVLAEAHELVVNLFARRRIVPLECDPLVVLGDVRGVLFVHDPNPNLECVTPFSSRNVSMERRTGVSPWTVNWSSALNVEVDAIQTLVVASSSNPSNDLTNLCSVTTLAGKVVTVAE